MDFYLPILLVLFCSTGVSGYEVPRKQDILSEYEIDNLSDESSDIIWSSLPPVSATRRPLLPLFDDPKTYGMNIGLHFLLEAVNRKLVMGDRVHLESLIKVLVMTHNIEKLGGTVNDNNKVALRNAAKLYPTALREAMEAA